MFYCIYRFYLQHTLKGEGWKDRKAQTTWDMSFGPLVSLFFFLFVLFDINGFFIVSIGYIYDICKKERVGGLGTTKQAQVSFFFSFFVLFDTDQIYIDIECKLQNTQHQEISSLRRDVSRASGHLPLPPPVGIAQLIN